MTEQANRYARQQQVAQLSGDAQQKLADAHVLVVGVGGLGSPLSLFLAGSGIGTLTLVDRDVVSLSNLHRQILYQESDIGKSKVEAAKVRLERLNSQITINAVNQRLWLNNAQDLVGNATVVVDAADNFLVSFLLSDLCLAARVPLISASVLSTHGYVGVYCGSPTKPAPSLRAVFPTPSSDAQNCNTAGVTGPSVGVISSLQAQEVLKVICDDDSRLLGKLLYLDLWNYQQNIVDFSMAKEPEKVAEFVALETLTEQDILLDVRHQQEIDQQPVTRVDHAVPVSELHARMGELDATKRIVCVCQSGQRALNAANILLESGFNQVAVTAQ